MSLTAHPLIARSPIVGRRIRAAVVGAGAIARQHIGALARLADVDVVAVADLSRVMAESTAERFSIPRFFTDAAELIDKTSPDVVHITTTPASHFPIARLAIERGCHVFIEKPITPTVSGLEELYQLAALKQLIVLEDLNYLFNQTTLRAARMLSQGLMGDLVHAEILLALDLVSPGHPFSDPHVPHPVLRLPGGAIHDFLPHMASLACAFAGPHTRTETIWRKKGDSVLPFDEFRAVSSGRVATSGLVFSALSQPDSFIVRLHGTKARITFGLFEPRFSIERLADGPRPLVPLRNAFAEAGSAVRGAISGLRRKLASGPGAYEGLFELIRRLYGALREGGPSPVAPADVLAVSRMVHDLAAGAEASRAA